MADIYRIYESIKYIEDNLKEPITVMDIASTAGYSLFHFSRTFSAVTGHNPYDYFMRRRLSEAALLMIKEGYRLTDIAFEFQFNNLETFSRAFKRMFGIAPVKYKAKQSHCDALLKAVPSLEYLEHINSNNFFKPALKNCPTLLLIATIQDLRHNLTQYQSMDTESRVLIFEPNKQTATHSRLMFKQVSSLESIPDNTVTKTVPALKCVQFSHITGDIKNTYDYIFQTWLPLSSHSLGMPYCIELLSQPELWSTSDDPSIHILLPIEKLK